jgi:hypothetical protein
MEKSHQNHIGSVDDNSKIRAVTNELVQLSADFSDHKVVVWNDIPLPGSMGDLPKNRLVQTNDSSDISVEMLCHAEYR